MPRVASGPGRIQVQVTDEAAALLDELVATTGLARTTLGAMALAVGINAISMSIKSAVEGVDPASLAPALSSAVAAHLNALERDIEN